MKHLLNNLSEEEKNSIREQHEGGMKLDTSRFRTLLESKSGNVKPLVERFDDEDEDDTCPQCGRGGYSYESGCEDCDDEENEYRWDAEDDEEEFEDDDFGYAQHDGSFDGDDSEFEDEEELDLREFDDLEEDDETW